MVRFFNKNLKAHFNESNEKLSNFMDFDVRWKFIELLKFHLRNFGGKSDSDVVHLLQKTTIHLSITRPADLDKWLNYPPKLKDFFLLIELILETYINSNKKWLEENYIYDFINDLNEFFLINNIELQIRYFSQKKEFYVEKVISPEVSEQIKQTLENFSKESKIFEDFKESIKRFSSGDFEGSIEKCCVSIEDYLCIILGKQSCSSVDTYYKEASKKLNIPEDLDNRFSNIISYIHKYRSHPVHGAIEKKEIPEPELTTEAIIQFTMAILNYLKKKNDKLEKS